MAVINGLSRRLAPGPNGIGRGWVESIIAPAYAGEFELYTQNLSHLARGMMCEYVSLVLMSAVVTRQDTHVKIREEREDLLCHDSWLTVMLSDLKEERE